MGVVTYATIDDLTNRYGTEITAVASSEGKNPNDSIAAALKDAAAEINGYIGLRYRLPLPGGAEYPALVWLSCDIARYRLWESRIEDKADNLIYVRYTKAVSFLERLAAGEGALSDENGSEPPLALQNAAAAVISEREKVFTNDLLKKMDYGF
jgi:phage gp36-like protein